MNEPLSADRNHSAVLAGFGRILSGVLAAQILLTVSFAAGAFHGEVDAVQLGRCGIADVGALILELLPWVIGAVLPPSVVVGLLLAGFGLEVSDRREQRSFPALAITVAAICAMVDFLVLDRVAPNANQAFRLRLYALGHDVSAAPGDATPVLVLPRGNTELSRAELSSRIAARRAEGRIDPELYGMEFDRQTRLSYPAGCVIGALLALAIWRQGVLAGPVAGILIASGVGYTFFDVIGSFLQGGRAAAIQGKIPAALAPWNGDVAVCVFVALLFLLTRLPLERITAEAAARRRYWHRDVAVFVLVISAGIIYGNSAYVLVQTHTINPITAVLTTALLVVIGLLWSLRGRWVQMIGLARERIYVWAGAALLVVAAGWGVLLVKAHLRQPSAAKGLAADQTQRQVAGAAASLKDPYAETQVLGVERLIELQATREISTTLLNDLLTHAVAPDEEYKRRRYVALRAVAEMGTAAAVLHDPVVGALKDTNDILELSLAAKALASIGGATEKDAAILIDKLLAVPSFAIAQEPSVLRRLGETGRPQIQRLREVLRKASTDLDYVARSKAPLVYYAAGVLALLGEATPKDAALVTSVADRYEDRAPDGAFRALERMGSAAAAETPRLLKLVERYPKEVAHVLFRTDPTSAIGLIRDRRIRVRLGALDALDVSPQCGPCILQLRHSAHDASGPAALATSEHALVDTFEEPLRCDDCVAEVRRVANDPPDALTQAAAFAALARQQRFDQGDAVEVGGLLDNPDAQVRVRARDAVRLMGRLGATEAERLRKLSNEYERCEGLRYIGEVGVADERDAKAVIRGAATASGPLGDCYLEALATLGSRAVSSIQVLLTKLNNADLSAARTRMLLLRAIESTGDDLQALVGTINPIYRYNEPHVKAELRFVAHLVGGGRAEAEAFLERLGRPFDTVPAPRSPNDMRDVLGAYESAWPWTEPYERLRNDLADKIRDLVSANRWPTAELSRVAHLGELLRRDGFTAAAEAVRVKVAERQNPVLSTWMRWIPAGVVAHGAFWLGLITVYPKSQTVQAVWFWNPWVRRIVGAGYVGLLLTWIPRLRRQVLSPFVQRLRAPTGAVRETEGGGPAGDGDARARRRAMDGQPTADDGYFEMRVRDDTGQEGSVLSRIPTAAGVIIVEGKSGLGKTSLLRHLIGVSERPAVFLQAARCGNGVIDAVSAKLPGWVADKDFLQRLIYMGGLDLYIDGLNEARPEARIEIREFLEAFDRANVIIATQSIEWEPPEGARRYELLPLSRDEIESFLVSRNAGMADNTRANEYAASCKKFLSESFSAANSDSEYQWLNQVLSNPFELTLIAELLREGYRPEPLQLEQQQYDLLRREYARRNEDNEFPLRAFAAKIYGLKCEGQVALDLGDCPAEADAMVARRMLVRRTFATDSASATRWLFRHERVMDFFVAKHLLTADGKWRAHLRDGPFRGAFAHIAVWGEASVAKEILEALVEDVTRGGDRETLGEYLRLFKLRNAA